MPSAPAVTPESPSPSPPRQRVRPRSPIATTNGSAAGDFDFELRHWRASTKKRAGPPALRWAPPPEMIEIPHSDDDSSSGGGGHGYTSLRDILSSPEYAAALGSTAARVGGGVKGCGVDVHMIRHPLVKHAAYAYLQMTPSGREDRHRGRRWRRGGPLCRLLLDCLSFIGALFRP